ncbi:MAG: hypothetical protein AAF380_00995 [Bacteroidota bacterium]
MAKLDLYTIKLENSSVIVRRLKKAALADFPFFHSQDRDFYNLLYEKKFIIHLIYNSTYIDAVVVYMLAHQMYQTKGVLDP